MHLAEVEGTIIACPLHGWRFDLRDNGTEIHGFRALNMYHVKVGHGTISVALKLLQPVACIITGSGLEPP
jgi:nitrite reductase/ring-hydroxylating ferredoxin subunit